MGWLTDYGHTMAKSLLLCGPNSNSIQIQIPIPNKYLVFGYKVLFFCRYNCWLMENMDKGLTVPKWVLINQLKTPQIPPKFFAQFVCLSPKVWNFWKKLSLGVRSSCGGCWFAKECLVECATVCVKSVVILIYRKVASSRPVYYSILNSFGQRSQYISIKFPLYKQSENP